MQMKKESAGRRDLKDSRGNGIEDGPGGGGEVGGEFRGGPPEVLPFFDWDDKSVPERRQLLKSHLQKVDAFPTNAGDDV